MYDSCFTDSDSFADRSCLLSSLKEMKACAELGIVFFIVTLVGFHCWDLLSLTDPKYLAYQF